ncbi:MAG: Crp/Fnr family transcriptional regulator [Desulfobacterales bacterium]|nr:Crp/Fnr family transcriptional regulator [Desulfobacterales bacterium]
MISGDERVALYRLYPVLEDLDEELVDEVLTEAQSQTLPRGTRVFDAFHPCRAFPFVLSGDLRVFKQSESGRELSLYHVRAGDACIVSAGCLLGSTPYNASGQVKAEARLIMLPDSAFDRLLAAPAFRRFVFSLISHRIVGLMQLVEEVAFHRLDRRLAGALKRKGAVIRISHQELADELGTVREMVTRVLHSFADEGLLALGRGKIEILDAEGLEAYISQ